VPDRPLSLESKVAALRRPGAYPGQPDAVEAIETHMSWVFLTGEHAFKLKKPVRYDGLDFGTLATRRFFCDEELRLNRRLTASVYLEVVALRQDAVGALRIGAEGAVVEWLVMMRRLPADLMLDQLLAQGRQQADQIRPVAMQLAAFYRGLRPAITDSAIYLERLRRDIDECERRLCDPEIAVDIEKARSLCAQLRSVLRERPELFAARVQAGKVVEGHGDLRPEHICMETPPAIIDCLEFSAELRTLDIADELGFLGLECERLGAPRLGRLLFDVYGELTGDVPGLALIDYYQGLRACIRAGLAIWHLKEARYRDSPKWPVRARNYLRLAGQHLQRCAESPQRS
jgi:aminoglycoside phosphotransferase family enzyme